MHHPERTAEVPALSPFEQRYAALQLLDDASFKAQYSPRIVIAGSREFNDYSAFYRFLEEQVDLDLMRSSGCFVSGAASKGADAMIIRWCKEQEILCKEYPADWDALGKRAGYVRNAVMSTVSTRLIAFWDSLSKGTKHMIDICKKERLDVLLFLCDTPDTEPTAVADRQQARKRLDHRLVNESLLEWSPEND